MPVFISGKATERMCGRFELIDGGRVFIRFPVMRRGPDLLDNRDVRPTQQVLVLQANYEPSLLRWGLVPAWAKDPRIGSKMINARAEGIADKPSFKRPLRAQRCLIPASAFFEWQGQPGVKVQYRIARKDGELFGFAGLYDIWAAPDGQSLSTCTIITTEPNAVVAPIHNRMPAILLPEDEDDWLNPDVTDVGFLQALLGPYPADQLQALPVASPAPAVV
jgi:putative SOS response-associated peptidase YedK